MPEFKTIDQSSKEYPHALAASTRGRSGATIRLRPRYSVGSKFGTGTQISSPAMRRNETYLERAAETQEQACIEQSNMDEYTKGNEDIRLGNYRARDVRINKHVQQGWRF